MPRELSPEELLRRFNRASAQDKKGIENIIIPCATKIKNARQVPPEKIDQWTSWDNLPQELLSKLLEEENGDARRGSDRHPQVRIFESDSDYFAAIEKIAATRWNTPEGIIRNLIRWASDKVRNQPPLPLDREAEFQEWKWVLLEIFRNLIYDRM